MEQGQQETAVAIESIGQQQTVGWDAVNEAMGQGDFRIGTGADRQRQGVMQPQLHQQAGPDLGESGVPASGAGFGELAFDGGRVEHGKEGAVDADEPEAMVEGVAMTAQRSPGTQDRVEHGFEKAPAQTLAAPGDGRTGKLDAGELAAMGAGGPLELECVKNQQGKEEEGAELGFTAFAGTELTPDATELAGIEKLRELFEENAWASQSAQTSFSLFLGSSLFNVVWLPGCLGFRLRGHPNRKTKFLDFRKSKVTFFFSQLPEFNFPSEKPHPIALKMLTALGLAQQPAPGD